MVGYGPDGGYPEVRILGVRDKFSGNAHCCARKCFRHRQWALPSPRFHGVCPFHAVYDGSEWRLLLFSDSPVEAECNMMMFWFAGKEKDLSLLWIDVSISTARICSCRRPFTAQPDGVLFTARPEPDRKAEEKTSGLTVEIRLCLSTVADGTARKIPIWE